MCELNIFDSDRGNKVAEPLLVSDLLFSHAYLSMSSNWSGNITLIQICSLFVRQFLAIGLQSFVQPLYLAKADDRAADTLLHQPRQRNIAHLPALLLRDLLDLVYELFISLGQCRQSLRSCRLALLSQRPC